jgi:AcrR family transcriptional regulator
MDVSSRLEPRTAPARSRSETRRRLLQAGAALFARRGLHRVTSHDLARAAGVAAGTFYLHFQDKEALFREVVFQAVRGLRERLDAVSQRGLALEQSVRARAEELLGFAEENRELVRVLFGRDHEAAGVGHDALDFLAETSERNLRQRGVAGACRLHPTVTAQALVGMWARVAAWWAASPSGVSREEVIETLVRIQLSGTHSAPSEPPHRSRP